MRNCSRDERHKVEVDDPANNGWGVHSELAHVDLVREPDHIHIHIHIQLSRCYWLTFYDAGTLRQRNVISTVKNVKDGIEGVSVARIELGYIGPLLYRSHIWNSSMVAGISPMLRTLIP